MLNVIKFRCELGKRRQNSKIENASQNKKCNILKYIIIQYIIEYNRPRGLAPIKQILIKKPIVCTKKDAFLILIVGQCIYGICR